MNDPGRDRRELKTRYGEAYVRLSAILFSEDPIGINFEENADEYEPEVGTILPRLQGCRDPQDVQRIVHEEFVRWFDPSTAGQADRYRRIAERIWAEVMPRLE